MTSAASGGRHGIRSAKNRRSRDCHSVSHARLIRDISAHKKDRDECHRSQIPEIQLFVRNHMPQQGAGAQQVGAAGAQHDTGAQQGSGAGQHGSQLWRRKHFLNIPENSPQWGLLHGSQHGCGAQHTGAGAQHGSGCGQHGSQQDEWGLKQPKRPASAD